MSMAAIGPRVIVRPIALNPGPDRPIPTLKDVFPGKESEVKVTSLRGRMLLLILPAVIAAIAVLAVLSISRATQHETKAVHDGLSNRTAQEAAAVDGVVGQRFAEARMAAGTLSAMAGQDQ